jgi:hypothetical protein
MTSEQRIASFRDAAESATLTGARRAAEMRSLASYLHKHQSDAFPGPARANLLLAIEAHHARAAAGADALTALLECALKMPDKVFNEAHKARMLKLLAACEAAAAAAVGGGGGGGGGAPALTAPAAAAPAARGLLVVDVDVGAGEVCLVEADGTAFAGAAPRVAAEAGGAPALAAALEAAAAKGCALLARVTAAGEVVGWEEGEEEGLP